MTEAPINFDEEAQHLADQSRLLKAGLRAHDPETVQLVMEQIARTDGWELANAFLTDTITRMMDEEQWSFFNEQTGEPSPLM